MHRSTETSNVENIHIHIFIRKFISLDYIVFNFVLNGIAYKSVIRLLEWRIIYQFVLYCIILFIS